MFVILCVSYPTKISASFDHYFCHWKFPKRKFNVSDFNVNYKSKLQMIGWAVPSSKQWEFWKDFYKDYPGKVSMREYVTEQNLWLCRVLGCAWQPNTLRLEVKTLNSVQISQPNPVAAMQIYSTISFVVSLQTKIVHAILTFCPISGHMSHCVRILGLLLL